MRSSGSLAESLTAILALLWGFIMFLTYPRPTPWAAIFRRFAAVITESFSMLFIRR
jgi:hypothetical protein